MFHTLFKSDYSISYYQLDYVILITMNLLSCLGKLSLINLLFLTGCTNIPYYTQSIAGQSEIIFKRQPIDDILANNSDAALNKKLKLSQNILGFAEHELSLASNGSYNHYVDLERPFVIWNVFAAPELSLEPKNWCYFFVGCLAYRGYFKREHAESLATELSNQGWDVYVGGVAAYSTLGWLKDPLLNTILRFDDIQLAKILFHELAHQKLYVKNDSEFNEAFADAVAMIGLEKWLDQTHQPERYQQLVLHEQYEKEFVTLLLGYKKRLEASYQSNMSENAKRQQKARLSKQFRQDYLLVSGNWNGYKGFESWADEPLNNARISAVSTYRELVPDFISLYQKLNKDLKQFYSTVEIIGACTKLQRRILLKQQNIPVECNIENVN